MHNDSPFTFTWADGTAKEVYLLRAPVAGINTVSTEIHRRVYGDREGAFIEVAPAGGDLIRLATVSKQSIDWFGKINLTIEAEMAKQLGAALIAAAKDMA